MLNADIVKGLTGISVLTLALPLLHGMFPVQRGRDHPKSLLLFHQHLMPRRPSTINKESARKAAILLFWKQGYNATPMIDLVGKTQMNRVALYEIFDDKHQLFLVALRHYQQRLHSQLLEVSSDANETVLERLRQILELAADDNSHDSSLPKGCFLLNAGIELLPKDADVQALVEESRHFLNSVLIALLSQGQQLGEIQSAASPQTQAHFLSTLLVGLRGLNKLTSDPKALRDSVEMTLAALTERVSQ